MQLRRPSRPIRAGAIGAASIHDARDAAIAGGVGRAPIDYHDLHMSALAPVVRKTANTIKRALDPNGIIAPGKYGIE